VCPSSSETNRKFPVGAGNVEKERELFGVVGELGIAARRNTRELVQSSILATHTHIHTSRWLSWCDRTCIRTVSVYFGRISDNPGVESSRQNDGQRTAGHTLGRVKEENATDQRRNGEIQRRVRGLPQKDAGRSHAARGSKTLFPSFRPPTARVGVRKVPGPSEGRFAPGAPVAGMPLWQVAPPEFAGKFLAHDIIGFENESAPGCGDPEVSRMGSVRGGSESALGRPLKDGKGRIPFA
jgi:hypothetical protein